MAPSFFIWRDITSILWFGSLPLPFTELLLMVWLILIGMSPQLSDLRYYCGSNEGDTRSLCFLRYLQTPVPRVGNDSEYRKACGAPRPIATRSTCWCTATEGMVCEWKFLTWVQSPKRDLHSLTPPIDREPTRVDLRHPHNSGPLHHELLPERWSVYTYCTYSAISCRVGSPAAVTRP